MSRESQYIAFILKKQPFNEGDELITIYTAEAGKLRALAKSVKLAKSKLQARLQMLFLVKLTLTHGKLPKIILAEPVSVFFGMRENLAAVKMSFYAAELVLKFTPDEQKNPALFNLLSDFLNFLDTAREQKILDLGLAKYKINILQTLGLDISFVQGAKFFSPVHGGFFAEKSADSWPVTLGAFSLFLTLKDCRFDLLPNIENMQNTPELQNLLSRFVEYQLERSVQSEKYLNAQS